MLLGEEFMLALLVFGCEEGCGVCVGFAFELIFGLLAFGLLELCAPELNVRICEPRFNFSLRRRLVATDLFNLRALLNISDSRQKKIVFLVWLRLYHQKETRDQEHYH